MENANKILAFALVAALIFSFFSFGCTKQSLQQPGFGQGQLVGNDRDSHGCIASAGYTWCEEKSKCIRSWEENCTSQLPGGDRDAHGCIGSAGYVWCGELGECIRPWETTCAAKSEVRVLTENFPPFNFKGSSGAVDGKSSEMVRLVLSKMGQYSDIEVMNWPEAYSLAASQPNVALYSAARSPQREKLFKWVGPIGTYDKTIYAKSGSVSAVSGVKTLEDAKKAKSICVVQYDDRAQFLLGLGFTNLVQKENDVACLRELVNGKAELWFGSTDTMPYVAAEAGLPQNSATPVLGVEKSEIYIMFSNSTPDATVQKWRSALDELKADGFYDTVLAWWGTNITPGSDLDEHGCIGSAGYVWCATLNKCVRPWETPCSAETGAASQTGADSTKPGQLVGGDRDEHGCIGSAGYQWCPEYSKCVRTWEEGCPSLQQKALDDAAKTHCAAGNTVYTCGDYIRVVSDMPGAGSNFYQLGNYSDPLSCPVVAPDYMSPECRLLLFGNNCVEKQVNCTSPAVPAAVKDLKDDPNFVGAQLSWSKPDNAAVDYAVYRGDASLKVISLITITGQTSYNDVFDGGNATYAYFVRARNAEGAQAQYSNIIYVQQLSTAKQPSPGQID